MLDWKVGDRVQCIDDKWTHIYGEIRPVKDGIYTIRNFVVYEGEVGIRLVEIINAFHQYRIGPLCAEVCECAFTAKYFRKLTERSTETGMEILRKLLDPAHKVLEDT